LFSLIGRRKARPRALLVLLLGCGVGGRLNQACWGGLATHLPGRLFRNRARVVVFWTNRYLGGCVFDGPVDVFRFFSA
jgi:hypothetical protein